MIGIGTVYRGPEHRDSRIGNALRKANSVIARLRPKDFRDGRVPWVNAVFVVAGSLGEPEFDDVRVGHFGKEDKGLVVEIAVPLSIVKSRNLRDAIVLGLRGANAVAFHFFDEKGMEFPLRDAEALVTRVGEELGEFA